MHVARGVKRFVVSGRKVEVAVQKEAVSGFSLLDVSEMLKDEVSAADWFASVFWPGGRCCGHCGGVRTKETKSGKPMPYWCPDCRSYFSIKTGTTMASSKVGFVKWGWAVYLFVTNVKGVSALQLSKELKVSHAAAWFMLHRIREAWEYVEERYAGPIEVDETYMGGKERNKHSDKKLHIKAGFGGKVAVIGIKDRATGRIQAKPITRTNRATMQPIVEAHMRPGTKVFTDDHGGYRGLSNHEVVPHGRGWYVDGEVHTQGIESFWSMLKRAHKGTYHYMSAKHLHRYVNEFTGRHNMRSEKSVLKRMEEVVWRMHGRRITRAELTGPNAAKPDPQPHKAPDPYVEEEKAAA